MKIRRKPIELDAVQWTGDNLAEVLEVLGSVGQAYADLSVVGDWIVKDENGFVHRRANERFHELYEAVEPAPCRHPNATFDTYDVCDSCPDCGDTIYRVEKPPVVL